ncbi:MAG: leucyl/phenylalanyl-tRNA--protein transferase, partial [Desulfovibrio sp.]|nr:leucyl/phenylalanyl-tRNA--protein transferase [Desulfovibrio sp.]
CACAQSRVPNGGTWLLPEMIGAYERLHKMGFAHSVEAWRDGELVGGLYGVGFARVFFGESMFHLVSEASRAALAGLVSLLRLRGVTLLDCQQETPHIMKMGGVLLPREVFAQKLRQALIPAATPAAIPASGLAEPGVERAPCKDRPGETDEEQVWQPWRESYDYSLSSGAWASRS